VNAQSRGPRGVRDGLRVRPLVPIVRVNALLLQVLRRGIEQLTKADAG